MLKKIKKKRRWIIVKWENWGAGEREGLRGKEDMKEKGRG